MATSEEFLMLMSVSALAFIADYDDVMSYFFGDPVDRLVQLIFPPTSLSMTLSQDFHLF